MSMNYNDNEYRLCYVEDNIMYFTDNFAGQWGDDWNDAPYEHNAGTPYQTEERAEALERYPDINKSHGNIRYVAYVNERWPNVAETPAETAHDNSPYSVEDINAGAAAWLSIPKRRTYLMAGATVEKAIAWCKENGIKVGELT